MTTAAHRATSCTQAASDVGGKSTSEIARNCTLAFHLPRRRAGIETPRRPSSTRYIEIRTSRAAMIATGHQPTSPRIASAKNPPSTRILSASGSRKAPDRVVPSRRANQPSMPSVIHSTSQPVNVAQESAPRSLPRISISTGIVNSSRAIVIAFAGVRIASGPKRRETGVLGALTRAPILPLSALIQGRAPRRSLPRPRVRR